MDKTSAGWELWSTIKKLQQQTKAQKTRWQHRKRHKAFFLHHPITKAASLAAMGIPLAVTHPPMGKNENSSLPYWGSQQLLRLPQKLLTFGAEDPYSFCQCWPYTALMLMELPRVHCWLPPEPELLFHLPGTGTATMTPLPRTGSMTLLPSFSLPKHSATMGNSVLCYHHCMCAYTPVVISVSQAHVPQPSYCLPTPNLISMCNWNQLRHISLCPALDLMPRWTPLRWWCSYAFL